MREQHLQTSISSCHLLAAGAAPKEVAGLRRHSALNASLSLPRPTQHLAASPSLPAARHRFLTQNRRKFKKRSLTQTIESLLASTAELDSGTCPEGHTNGSTCTTGCKCSAFCKLRDCKSWQSMRGNSVLQDSFRVCMSAACQTGPLAKSSHVTLHVSQLFGLVPAPVNTDRHRLFQTGRHLRFHMEIHSKLYEYTSTKRCHASAVCGPANRDGHA